MDILGPADGLQLDTVRGPGSSEQVAHVNMPPGMGVIVIRRIVEIRRK